ncbi:MAG: hypothetical protein R2991_04720 [Thermoanaerobaculia bacterium]
MKRPERTPSERAAAALLAVALACAGCAGTGSRPEPSARPPVPGDDLGYLVPPLDGYPAALPLTAERELSEAHRALVAEGDTARAEELAARWLEEQPDLAPARVLAAQVAFVRGDAGRVQELLEPVVTREPRYVAAQLVRGRAAEREEDIVAAMGAYFAIREDSPLARASVQRLRGPASEALRRRFDDALGRGRTDLARRALAELEQWSPNDEPTLEAALALGEAEGDAARALSAARRLAQRRPGDRGILEAQARWELEAGDAGTGLRLLEELAAAYPDDPRLQDRAAAARFQWRLQLLPATVRPLADGPQLSRGDLAGLLYWLFPSVRYGRAEQATIATDILDHPLRREIARVINLGVMDVEPGLHHFRPLEPATRREALAAVLGLLGESRPPAACLAGAEVRAGEDSETVCRLAAVCGLIPAEADCLPQGAISGR